MSPFCDVLASLYWNKDKRDLVETRNFDFKNIHLNIHLYICTQYSEIGFK